MAALLTMALGPVLLILTSIGFRAHALGYRTTGAYLSAAPLTEAEKRDAVDLALKGLILCVLGLLFWPVVFGGLVGLFYGGRKLVFASMGLGLVDDADEGELGGS